MPRGCGHWRARLVAARRSFGFAFRLQLKPGEYVARALAGRDLLDEAGFTVGAEPVEVLLAP